MCKLSAHHFKAQGFNVMPLGPWPYRMKVGLMNISDQMSFELPELSLVTCYRSEIFQGLPYGVVP